MNKKKYVLMLVSFVFCFILFSNTKIVFADVIKGTITDTTLSDIKEGFVGTVNFRDMEDGIAVTTPILSFSTLGNDLKKNYCTKFLECAENNFSGLDFIDTCTVVGTYYELVKNEDGELVPVSRDYSKTSPITSIPLSFLDYASGEVFTITFKIGEKEYEFYTYTSKYVADSRRGGYSIKSKSGQDAFLDSEYRISQNTNDFLEYLKENAIEGIIAGSIGAGFNVGVPYSEKQVSLTSLMELDGNGYDFKNLGSVDFTFSYYYSPIFGKLYLTKNPTLPKTTAEWITYGKSKVSTFIQGQGIKLNPGFADYAATLSEDTINSMGEKISDVEIEGGARRLEISGSKDPKSVISYNMPMVVPYMYEINGGRGKLVMEALRPIEDFEFCLFNDRIYKTANGVVDTSKHIAIMSNVMGNGNDSRNNLFLYRQNVEVEDEETGETKILKTGVVIVAYYDECVVDTTQEYESGQSEKNLFLTGRHIGFDNGYSDALDFKNANSKLMFATSDSGVVGYSPLNVSFPVPGVSLKQYSLYNVWHGDFVDTEPELTEAVKKIMMPFTTEEMFKYINNIDVEGVSNVHGSVPESVKVVKFFINFGPIVTGSKVENTEDSNNPDNDGSKWAFYIIRNNKYIKDESLIEWLKTDEARALTYVDADTLLKKITGDFTNSLGKLTYEDWLKMQSIKGELDYNKDTWLIRCLNVLSIVLGVFLIIFAILFMLAYWIDVFNTFTDFSFLQFISFGNLFPVAEKETISYLSNIKGMNMRYVTFKDVLILACLMIAVGILFMNVSFIVTLIVKVYNYLLYTFGGV